MHEKRKKYYHIRKDLFWYTILLAVSFLIGYAIHQHHGIFLTHSLKADAPKERIEITFDDLQSSLKDLSTCYLCGSSDYSMMDYYRKFDTVGLISLNDWHVLDFQLKAYDESGNEIPNKTAGYVFSSKTCTGISIAKLHMSRCCIEKVSQNTNKAITITIPRA